MKLFSVHVDRDRPEATRDDDGKRSVKIDRITYRYAAENIEAVWDHHRPLMMEEYDTLIAVIEDAPAVTIIKQPDTTNPRQP